MLIDTHDNIWMEPESGISSPCIIVFRNCFSLEDNKNIHLKFSADERCMLFLDGKKIAEGPERGTAEHWYYGEFLQEIPAGDHILTARVLCFGNAHWALGQMGIRPGLWIYGAENLLYSDWECQVLEGCRLIRPLPDWGAFPKIRTDADFNWDVLNGKGGSWQPVRYYKDQRPLNSPELPSMRSESIRNFSWDGQTVVFPEYHCAWAEYEFSGNGRVDIRWKESSEPDGSLWDFGNYDSFEISGNKVRWTDYWWHAGQRIEFRFTGDVSVDMLRFYDTGYPFELKKPLYSTNPTKRKLLRMAWKTLQCCSYETFMDCPYFEQLQYVGDSRIEALCVMAATGDYRLPRKALRMLGDGIQPDGTMFCRYPTREKATDWITGMDEALLIPGFAILYIQMVHDFAVNGDDENLIRELIPKLNRIVDWLERYRGEDLILNEVPGWNFIDWVDGWHRGIPPYCEDGTGCTLNLMYVISLRNLAEMESLCGCPQRETKLMKIAEEVYEAVNEIFFDHKKNCFAEDAEHRVFSEHAQIFALLAGYDHGTLSALSSGKLAECSIYFSFYLFEVCALFELDSVAAHRMKKYYELTSVGGDTLPEEFKNFRSRCHAWSANILYFHFREHALFSNIKYFKNYSKKIDVEINAL